MAQFLYAFLASLLLGVVLFDRNAMGQQFAEFGVAGPEMMDLDYGSINDIESLVKRASLDRSAMARFGKRAPLDRSAMARFGKRAPLDRSAMVRFGKRAPLDRSAMARFGK